MTKPANFPGRKLQRQRKALARFSTKQAAARPDEFAALKDACAVMGGVAQQVKTKKDRRDRARMRAA